MGANLMTSRKKSPGKENLKAIDLLKLLRKSLVAMNQLREKKRAKKKGELSEGSLHPQKNKDARRVKKTRMKRKIKPGRRSKRRKVLTRTRIQRKGRRKRRSDPRSQVR